MRLEGSYAFDATLRETPTNLPKLPKLLFRNAEYAESAENNVRAAEGVTILLLSFLDFKIPRPSAESFLLRI